MDVSKWIFMLVNMHDYKIGFQIRFPSSKSPDGWIPGRLRPYEKSLWWRESNYIRLAPFLKKILRRIPENLPPHVTRPRLSIRFVRLQVINCAPEAILRHSLFEFILFWLPGAILKLYLPNFLNFLPKALCLCRWVADVKCVGGNDSILAKSVTCIMTHHTYTVRN